MRTICIDCRYVRPRPSGIGEMVQQLVRHLPPLAPEWRFTLLVAPDRPEPLSAAPNVQERVVRSPANGPGTMWLLPRIVDLSGVDLFHAPSNIMPAGLAMPCVTTVHDLMWLDRPEWCETGWRGRARGQFFGHGIARALRKSAAIACVSEATRSAVLARRPDAAGRAFVTRSGVSACFVPGPEDAAQLAALGLAPQRRIVLTVGQNAPYKNHAGALQAFALAAATRPDICLVLVQRQGPAGDQLLRQARALGVGDRVQVLPKVGAAELRLLYRAAAVLLHPSLCEGFGNPLAEAMASGCPVVTSAVSAMPEVTAGAALLADPTDPAALAVAVGQVLDDPALAASMRERGLVRAAELDWAAFARANLAIYRRLLS